jgi:uncharacterized membrane protein
MTATLLRVSFTGAYLVILYFFGVPLVQGPTPAHRWGNCVAIIFCLCNIVSFWVVAPKALRATLGGLNVLLGVVALAVTVTLALGKVAILDEGNVVPLLLYFLAFVPFVTAAHQLRLGVTGAGHDL